MSRFRHLEVYARMFARFKMKFDPMFPKLAEFVTHGGTILDAGCGYGVQGVWLKCLYPDSRICALDPDAERVRIARRVLGDDDRVYVSTAQDFKDYPEVLDIALLLDMIHYINDEDLERTFRTIHSQLKDSGRLIIRATVPSSKKVPWERWLEVQRNRIIKNTIWLRSEGEIKEMLVRAGFRIILLEPTAQSREETWFVAETKAAPENSPC